MSGSGDAAVLGRPSAPPSTDGATGAQAAAAVAGRPARSSARSNGGTTHAPATERLRADALRNRERVLAAALDVYGERGPAFTMEEVASRARVGIGTVYRRFPTKNALLDAIARPCFERMLGLAQTARSQPDPSTALETFVRTVAEEHARDGVRTGRLWDAALGAPVRDQIEPVVEELIVAAREAGRLRPHITYQDVAVLLWSITALIDAVGAVTPAVWRRHLDVALDGMCPTSGGGPAAPPVPPAEWEHLVGSTPILRLR